VTPSVSHLIESHAVMDLVSSWDPCPGSLETWVSSDAGVAMADRIEGPVPVAEASGPYEAWSLSDHVAVHTYWSWTGQRPRTRAVQLWTPGEEGRRQVHLARESLGPPSVSDDWGQAAPQGLAGDLRPASAPVRVTSRADHRTTGTSAVTPASGLLGPTCPQPAYTDPIGEGWLFDLAPGHHSLTRVDSTLIQKVLLSHGHSGHRAD
jgi:hypothetical protein